MENEVEKKMFHSTYHGKLGITDLWTINPYDQNYGSYLNNHFNVTEEEYLKDVKGYEARVIKHNQDYLAKLIRDNKYGQEYLVELDYVYNPLFDKPLTIKDSGLPLESYRMYFLDATEYNGESNIIRSKENGDSGNR